MYLRQTDWTDKAGDQSSVNIDKQIWPLLYTCGWIGILEPINVTSGESNGYRELNLNCNWNFSPSYNVPEATSISTTHLKNKKYT